MKKYLGRLKNMLVGFLFLSNSLIAQVTSPLPTENAKWVMEVTCFESGDTWTTFGEYEINGDSIINGQEYVVINEGHFFYRVENEQVYAVSEGQTEEFLLFDFDLEEGDEFEQNWILSNWSYSEMNEILSIDSILTLDGIYRKRMNLNNYTAGACGENSFWIYGIGAGYSNPLVPNCFECISNLALFWQNDTLIYDNPFVSIDEILDQKNIILSPNPSNEILKVEIPNKLGQDINYEIIDTNGKSHQIGKTNIGEINITGLKKGIYFLKIYDETMRHFEKFVKE